MATEDEIKAAAKAEMFKRLAAAELKRRQAKSHPSFEESQTLIDREAQSGVSGGIGAGLSGYVEGLPVAGPILMGGAKRLAAGVASLIDGDSYEANLEQADTAVKNAQEQHPVVSTVGKVAGAVGGTLPLIAAAPTAFGAGAGSTLAKTALSAASGTALGGADSAVRSGGDPWETFKGAGAGLVLGGIGPAVGNLVGKGVKSLMEVGRNRLAARAAGIDPEALKYVRRAVTDDALDAPAVRQKLADMGPDAMLADLGPNLRLQAGALASTPGRGQEIVRTAMNNRSAGANARIQASVNENLGPAVIPSQVDDVITQGQQALSPRYGQVFQNARAVDTRPIAEALESQAVNLRGEGQRAAQRMRKMLDITDTNVLDPDPATLFQTRQAIDGLMTTEANPQALRVYAQTRQQVDEMLADAVPQLKEVDATFAELARQREALGRGQQLLESNKTSPRPVELVGEVDAGVQPQGLMIGPSGAPFRMTQGLRAEIDRIIGTNANNVVALNKAIKGDGSWNRDRLATMFGSEKADQLIRLVDSERAFADTANTVTRNSETAGRQAAQSELGGAGVGFGAEEAFKAGGLQGLARSVALDKGKRIAAALLPQTGEAARESLAQTLVNTNRDAVVRALMSTGGQVQAPALISPVVRALLMSGVPAGAR